MKIGLIPLLLGVAISANAESLIECLDPDVAATLVGAPGQEKLRFSSTIPPGTRMPELPNSLELIGSRESRGVVLVAYKSSQSSRDVQQAVADEPQADWSVSGQSPTLHLGGFQKRRAMPITSALSFCSNSDGRAQVNFRPREEKGTYVTVSVYTRHNTESCEESERVNAMHWELLDMPTLLLPEGANTLKNGGISGGGDSRTTSAVFGTSLPLPTVLADFGNQLLKQGWQQEGGWSGNISQGSSWVGPDEESYAVLSLSIVDDASYKAILNVMSLGNKGDGSTSMSMSSVISSV